MDLKSSLLWTQYGKIPALNTPLIILLISWLDYVSAYFMRKPMQIVKTAYTQELNLTDVESGWVDTSNLVGYAFGQFFFTPIIDRLGVVNAIEKVVCSRTYHVMCAYRQINMI